MLSPLNSVGVSFLLQRRALDFQLHDAALDGVDAVVHLAGRAHVSSARPSAALQPPADTRRIGRIRSETISTAAIFALTIILILGGVGTALYYQGKLCPHLELAHHPFRKDETYNDQLGEAARERIGTKKWSNRVKEAIDTLHDLVLWDHCFLGGGNSHRVKADLGTKVTVVDNDAGILGGIKLWERDTL